MGNVPWRLLQDGPADGAWNLAVDEAVSLAVGADSAPATLRFYGWSAPTLSLGCLQKTPGGVDLAACRALQVAVVRRVTGGRAVLHAAELTYSVAAPLRGPWRSLSVAEAFAVVCHALIAGLARLGLAAELGESGTGPYGSPEAAACFLQRRMPAVLVGGRKLIGSAQRRWDRSLLQQGSILLDFDPRLHQAVFPGWSRTDPMAGITCLRALLGRQATRGEVMSLLASGWSEALGAPCLPGTLSPDEERAAAGLAERRYGSAGWTFRR